jgi:hypothetical protein
MLKRLSATIVLSLWASVALAAFAIFQVASTPSSSIVSNTGVWLDGGVGAGDLTAQILIYPDCTSSTPFQCTKLMRTDTESNFIWAACTRPSCLINGAADGGYGWAPIPLPSSLTNAQALQITTGNSGGGQYPGGSQGLAACAWTTDQAQTLTGRTSDIYVVMNGTVTSSSTQGTIYVSTNKGASWTDTGQVITVQGTNNENARNNSTIVWCDPNSSGQIAYAGSYNATLFKTTNGGGSWTSVAGGLPSSSGNATEVIGDPTSTVTSGVTQGIYAWVQGSGLYASTNGGTAWTAVTATGEPSGNSYYPMKIDKFGQVWIFANGATSPIYKYSGGGAGGTWTNLSGVCNGSYTPAAFDSTSTSAGAERMYAWCADNAAYYSANGGSTWTALEALVSATVNAGGSGCTSGVQTFTVSGGTSIAAATFTGTVSGGSLSGALSVVIPGSYTAVPGGDPTVTGGGCSVAPSIVPSWTTNAINLSTATNTPGGGDVPWLSDGPSARTFTDVHDATFDLAGNLYLASGYGAYYAAHNSIPVFAVQSVGFESSASEWISFPAQGLGFSSVSWDTGMSSNVVPGLYAWTNFASSSPTFEVQNTVVAGEKPWITCQAQTAPWGGCSSDGGHTFTTWSTNPGAGPLATIDGQDILVLTGGALECSTNGGGSWSAVSGPPADIPAIFEKSSGVYEYTLAAQNVNGLWTSSGGCAGTWTEVNSTKQAGLSFGIAGQIGLILENGGGGNNAAISTNSGVTWTPLNIEYPSATVTAGAGKPGSGTSYALYGNGTVSGTYGTWVSNNAGSTWTAVSTFSLNGFFPYGTPIPPSLSADLDIYGVLEGSVDGLSYGVIGLSDSCPAVYWSPKITYPTMNVTGTVTLTAQDAGLAVPTAISFKVDGSTIASFTPSTTAASYSYAWNSGSVATGAHTLAVVSNGNGCTGISKSIPITTH